MPVGDAQRTVPYKCAQIEGIREEEANVYVIVTSLPKCVYGSFYHSQIKTIALEGDFRSSALD